MPACALGLQPGQNGGRRWANRTMPWRLMKKKLSETGQRRAPVITIAAGIISCEGDFEAGSSVRVLSADGREIARGLVSYGSAVLRKLAGHRSEDFEALLADTEAKDLPEEAIHRDNLVLMV